MNVSFGPTPHRLLAGMTSLAIAAMAMATGASAQNACGSQYVIEPGDTMHSVTRQCNVDFNALLQANSDIDDIDRIEIGMSLDIPGAEGKPDATGKRSTDTPGRLAALADDDGRLMVEGEVSSGTECPLVRTAGGDVFSLAGAPVHIAAGDYVRVIGSEADMSLCMQGEATISVSAMSRVAPPPMASLR